MVLSRIGSVLSVWQNPQTKLNSIGQIQITLFDFDEVLFTVNPDLDAWNALFAPGSITRRRTDTVRFTLMVSFTTPDGLPIPWRQTIIFRKPSGYVTLLPPGPVTSDNSSIIKRFSVTCPEHNCADFMLFKLSLTKCESVSNIQQIVFVRAQKRCAGTICSDSAL